MRIGIDAHHINGKPQGSRTYLIQLIRALSLIANGDELRIYSFRPEETRAVIEADSETLTHHRVFPESARLRLPFVVPALELLDGLSVFHSQYIAPPLSMVPEVVTIHDVLFETHPHLFEGAFSRRSVQMIRRSARRSRVVLTVSEFSRQALIEEYGLSEDKVLVTPDAVDREQYRPLSPTSDVSGLAELRARYGLDAPFVLTVGRLEPRKNLGRLIRAFARMRSRIDSRLSLVLVGAEDFGSHSIMDEARALPEGAVRTLGTVPDADLPGLYRLAEAMAYPSLVEGFGMPVLEAMACGIPVMTAARGALPEVGGDAVLWIDPENEAAIEDGLERILTETSLRETLRAKGLKRADKFSWTESAQRTLSAYRMAANH